MEKGVRLGLAAAITVAVTLSAISVADAQATVNAVRTAGKQFMSMEFSQAQHGFNCEERGSYNEAAAMLARERSRAFLAKHLKK